MRPWVLLCSELWSLEIVRAGRGYGSSCWARAATSAVTAPESMARAARAMAARKASWLSGVEDGTTPAAMRTAAALSRTTSRRGPGSPAKMARRMAALAAASPPRRLSMGADARPTCSGVRRMKVTASPRTSASWVGPEMESSSMPEPPADASSETAAVDDEGVADAEQAHGLGDDGNQVRGVDAHDLGARSGGVGERAEDVE